MDQYKYRKVKSTYVSNARTARLWLETRLGALLRKPRADMAEVSKQVSIVPQGNNSSIAGESHSMRITNHGKIKSWVDFSLNFLKVNSFFFWKFGLHADHGEKEQ